MHPVLWNPPAPLWPDALADTQNGERVRFERPELLRYAVDDFMDAFRETLSTNPAALGHAVVRPETWRTASGWDTIDVPGLSETVKLYQPAHKRFYLVTASLVCRTRGLPDRRLRLAKKETAAFVVRRVVPREDDGAVDVTDPTSFDEFGWCGDAVGWQPVATIEADRQARERATNRGDTPPTDGVVEETIPMFPVTFPVRRALDARRPEAGRTLRTRAARPSRAQPLGERTLWAGLIPVGRREAYETAPNGAAPSASDVQGDATFTGDPRDVVAEATILQPLAQLESRAEDVQESVFSASNLARLRAGAEGVRDAFVYALLDVVQFARQHLPDLADAIETGTWSGRSAEQEQIWDDLDAAFDAELPSDLGSTWRDALTLVNAAAGPVEEGLDLLAFDADLDIDSLFSLDATTGSIAGQMIAINANVGAVADSIAQLGVATLRTHLRAAVAALPDAPDARPPDVPAPVQTLDGSEYVVRCVYDQPRCAPYATRTESLPSRLFEMASFFDPDAPARPLQVNLPVDPSVGGLRGAAKGVSFLFSDQLRKQIERVQNATISDLEDGEVDDGGGVSIGMICSLSIPIITICAMILLLIIVSLLNIVFWWLPFFKICFPIPQGSSD